VVELIFNVVVVTPEYGELFGTFAQPLPVLNCHWYELAEPLAETLKLALPGAVTPWLAGCDVTEGNVQPVLTVKVAALLVAADVVQVLVT
jgi:hypothetical protein